MPSRMLGETPEPEIPTEQKAPKPWYPSLHLTKKQLGDLFGALQVGDSRKAAFVIKVTSKTVHDEGQGSVSIDLISMDIDEENFDDMTVATVAAVKQLREQGEI